MIEWSISKKKTVSSTDLGKTIWRAAYSVHTNSFYVLYGKEKNAFIAGYKAPVNGTMQELPPIELPEIKGTCKQLRISQSGKVLGAIIGKSLLYTRLDKKPMVSRMEHEITLISLALSPNDTTIATGDFVGKLCFWHIGDEFTKSSYHWHSHTIECLEYNSDGAILYSGGHEGVLVLWHNNVNTRTFLPRLPSQLATLSTSSDGTLLSICLSNNTIKIIKYLLPESLSS